MSKVRLQSSDGRLFVVDSEIAMRSVTIKNFVEDFRAQGDTTVPLPNVNSATLHKVLEWLYRHKNDAEPLDTEKPVRAISQWDAGFLTVARNEGMLFELIAAGNYLGLQGLLEVSGKFVANSIKGKTPQEMGETFNIKMNLTAAEKDQISREMLWRDH